MLIHVDYAHVRARVYGIAQLHHNWNHWQKGCKHSSPGQQILQNNCSCGHWGMVAWTFRQAVSNTHQICLCFTVSFCQTIKQVFSCIPFSNLEVEKGWQCMVSNVETPCQKGLHGGIDCYYQWIPFENQRWSTRMWCYFVRKCSKSTLGKINAFFKQNSNLIKFDFLDIPWIFSFFIEMFWITVWVFPSRYWHENSFSKWCPLRIGEETGSQCFSSLFIDMCGSQSKCSNLH